MTLTKKIIVSGLALLLVTLLSMGLFSFFKRSPVAPTTSSGPYKDSATNLIYNLLFCDDLSLYKANTASPQSYPFDILFSDRSSVEDLQKVINDSSSDPRVKVLACNKLISSGHRPVKKEVFAVIVEVGLDNGLDVLASFNNGTARYINHTGKILVWETTTDAAANNLTKTLFSNSQKIVDQIKPWNNPRRPYPTRGNARITFLVSDGLAFGEGPIDDLFNDPMGGAALTSATQLMLYLTQKSLQSDK